MASNPIPDLLVDGYISQSFKPNGRTEGYLCSLLKINQWGLRQLCRTLLTPGGSGGLFVVTAIPNNVTAGPLQNDGGSPLWLLDYSVVPMGTVVPQALWFPHNVNDLRQYVTDATLQMPIFFVHEHGTLGLSLDDAINGRCHTLRDAQMHAQLGGRVSTHIRISWPGYTDYKRQVQIRDETLSRNPITVAKFAHHVGRTVEAFLRNLKPNQTRSIDDGRWIIGEGGINRTNIRVIGAVHVSAGSWMPILQLNVWVF
ncbi:hypothetical protein BC826DRAFT_256982 [Russula brevipes]|nr:hypothetical protein BC826DRAFT_256982 [Russula brevipes]